jgi:glycosyltransferase involved in cell wall biosynthesis
MLVSVIIPTYNEEKSIAECILSLKKQTLKNIEIICVDDGSADNTLNILEKLGIGVYKQKHQGPAMARNLGAKKAQGKILVFVDADMTFDSNFLRNLIKPITQNKTKGTFSREEFVGNWDNVWARCWNINEGLPDKKRLPILYPDHQKVFRAILKSEFDKVGGFSKGGYTDDYTLSEKLGYEATAVNDAIFYHKNPDSLGEVYSQAKWVGKRNYKLGGFGTIFTLIKSTFFGSILYTIRVMTIRLTGHVYTAIDRQDLPYFAIFKCVYDFGIFVGILEMIFTGKLSK